MRSRFLGGILLIIGTCIGGGMLALPLANAENGFWYSSLLLGLCWLAMTFGALFILEANLYLPQRTHLLSIARATLGWPGYLISWVAYLFLLYILLCAYIAGGADVLGSLLLSLNIAPHQAIMTIAFTGLFGLVVYQGIYSVDMVNRLLMFGKLGAYLLLAILLAPHIQTGYIEHHPPALSFGNLMILITSFGFAIIVPNLRDYFDNDIARLKKALWIGSLIPLLCYIVWDAVIMGSVPNGSLLETVKAPNPTTELSLLLDNSLHTPIISGVFRFFSSICMFTAFLGVSLSLMSFLADGLKMQQAGRQGIFIAILCYLPPLLLVLYCPGAYLAALNYAGIFCAILLLIIPALMVLCGRRKFHAPYRVFGGSTLAWLVIVFAVLSLYVSLT